MVVERAWLGRVPVARGVVDGYGEGHLHASRDVVEETGPHFYFGGNVATRSGAGAADVAAN